MRICSSDLELFDRMLASLESRRTRALRTIAEYRTSFAHQLQWAADQIVEQNNFARLQDAAIQKSAANLLLSIEIKMNSI